MCVGAGNTEEELVTYRFSYNPASSIQQAEDDRGVFLCWQLRRQPIGIATPGPLANDGIHVFEDNGQTRKWSLLRPVDRVG